MYSSSCSSRRLHRCARHLELRQDVASPLRPEVELALSRNHGVSTYFPVCTSSLSGHQPNSKGRSPSGAYIGGIGQDTEQRRDNTNVHERNSGCARSPPEVLVAVRCHVCFRRSARRNSGTAEPSRAPGFVGIRQGAPGSVRERQRPSPQANNQRSINVLFNLTNAGSIAISAARKTLVSNISSIVSLSSAVSSLGGGERTEVFEASHLDSSFGDRSRLVFLVTAGEGSRRGTW